MKTFFDNLPVKKKIIGGFAIVLLLLSLVSFTGYTTIESASHGFTQYRGWAINTNTVGRVQTNLLEARLQVKNYVQTGDEKFLPLYDQREKAFHQFIEQALNSITEESNLKLMKEISEMAQTYNSDFQKVVKLVEKRNDIVDNMMNKLGVVIVNTQLTPLLNSGNQNAGNAIKHLLFARLYALKFLEDNSVQSAERVYAEFEAIDNYLRKIGRNDIIKNKEQYLGAFHELVNVIKERNILIEEKLDKIGPAIADKVEEIKLAYKSDQDRLGPALQASNQNGTRIVLYLSIGILILGAIVSVVISNTIVHPLLVVKERITQLQSVCFTNLGNSLLALAEGKIDHKVEKVTTHLNFSQKDEVGEMARTVDDMISKTHAGIDAYEEVRNKIAGLSFEAQQLITEAKHGRLDKRGDGSTFDGAYREIIYGFNEVLDAVIDPIKAGADVLEIMATGDLRARVEADYKGEHAKIKNSINKLGDSLEKVIMQVSEAIQSTASASNQISTSTEEMSAGAQEQSTQAAEVAASVEQMTKTILENSRNASLASDAAKQAGTVATQGGEVLKQTITGMNQIATLVTQAAQTVSALGENSNKIGEIVQVINDIADQTNLLALNAAIEAARAGEQGRGFAVVADEVRKLAERTTKATKEIAEMIKTIQHDTDGAVESINHGKIEAEKGTEMAKLAGSSLDKIISSSQEVEDIITQVASGNEEQATAAEQISRNIESISSVTYQSASGVEQVARASENLNNMTEDLQNLIQQFKVRQQSEVKTNSYSVRSNGRLVAH